MMKKFFIEGDQRLSGTVSVDGAKNSAVALIPATILAESEVFLEGLPNISDVAILYDIIGELGGTVRHDSNIATIDTTNLVVMPLQNGNVKKIRASYYFMGAMLGRFKEAEIGLPGGCHIGSRPIDQHIKGFKALGAKVTNENGVICLRADELRGAHIYLDYKSVGATINIILAAVLAKGKTVIENAAKEPEVVDVTTLLINMGACIKGAGTDTICVTGVESLHGCHHKLIPDRIEAGTYMIIAAAVGDKVRIENIVPDHIEGIHAKLTKMGVRIEMEDNAVTIYGVSNLKKVYVKTGAYPGFPTDLQQPLTVLLTLAEGYSVVTDTIYPNRFKHIPELARMGGIFKQVDRSVVVYGKTELRGAHVTATDLRAGAALVVAGLIAKGKTEIADIEHIERGYSRIIAKLTSLGAKITKRKICQFNKIT